MEKEDDILYQKNLAKKLEGLDLDTKCFSSGEDCIHELLETPEIIILDFNLNSQENKSFNGLKVLQEVKRIAPNTYVIMLSANDSLDIAVESIKEGCYDYITKNETAFVRLDAKITAIKHLIEIKQALAKSKFASKLRVGIIVAFLFAYFIIKLFFK